jgi:hypothetical protein
MQCQTAHCLRHHCCSVLHRPAAGAGDQLYDGRDDVLAHEMGSPEEHDLLQELEHHLHSSDALSRQDGIG